MRVRIYTQTHTHTLQYKTGTKGVAYIRGMCRSYKSDIVVTNAGLQTAKNLAHELGHTLVIL